MILPPIVLAIVSGKGGVGKTTVSVNMAVHFANKGYKVGLIDADIYGPSITEVMKEGAVQDKSSSFLYKNYNITYASLGHHIPAEDAVLWRGPMIQKAVHQLFSEEMWHAYDLLLVDLPPGTGDIMLSLGQKKWLTHGVLVSTSHPLAIADVRRSWSSCKTLGLSVIGCVQNMIGPENDQASGIPAHSLDVWNTFLSETHLKVLAHLPWVRSMGVKPYSIEYPESLFSQKCLQLTESIIEIF